MTTVFLSYSRGDDGEPFDPQTSFVARLHRDLTARGLDVWFDRVSMPSRSLTFHQEIRDAIAACERVVLVVGPKAAPSEYVRKEWQFAYFEAEKIIAPILRLGDFPVIPDELKLLHCEDFRDDAQYGFPALPAHYLSRTDRLVSRDARAIASGPVSFPFLALARAIETVIEQAACRSAIAWYPAPLVVVATHPCGRNWAGATGDHLVLIELEGSG